jgi:uncharacterized protein YcbK (DUF882 family)
MVAIRRRRLFGCACCAASGLLTARPGSALAAVAADAPALAPAAKGSRPGPHPVAAPASAENWRARLLQGPRSLWLVRGNAAIRSTYWTPEAGYDGDAYREICWLLRDVQANKSFAMSLHLLDVLCGLQNWLAHSGVRQAIHVNSGYRSFATNWRTEGAALNSRHVLGKAADIVVPGVTLSRLAGMASLFGRGGVGMYLNKGFVHVDTGEERIWIK